MGAASARLAGALLLHASVLLALLSGAGLATAARLKWDPSAYVPLRELLPAEYRAAAAALCAASLAQLALAHAAVLALALRAGARRALLRALAAGTAALVAGEAAWLGWTAARVAAWLRGQRAARVAEALAVRDQLAPLLQALARWHPLPEHLRALLAEAEQDAPHNVHAAGAALALAALLQPAAALLALLAARAERPPPPRVRYHSVRLLGPVTRDIMLAAGGDDTTSYTTSARGERAPLRTAYRAGKLVVL